MSRLGTTERSRRLHGTSQAPSDDAKRPPSDSAVAPTAAAKPWASDPPDGWPVGQRGGENHRF